MSSELKPMSCIKCKVPGSPAVRRSNRTGPEAKWSEAIRSATSHFPQVEGPCHLRVTFFLPADKYAGSDHGADLDNLLKPFLDGLGKTIFRDIPGGDGCVHSMEVTKLRATKEEPAGAYFEVIPFHVSDHQGG